jgi:hypothetical protein
MNILYAVTLAGGAPPAVNSLAIRTACTLILAILDTITISVTQTNQQTVGGNKLGIKEPENKGIRRSFLSLLNIRLPCWSSAAICELSGRRPCDYGVRIVLGEHAEIENPTHATRTAWDHQFNRDKLRCHADVRSIATAQTELRTTLLRGHHPQPGKPVTIIIASSRPAGENLNIRQRGLPCLVGGAISIGAARKIPEGLTQCALSALTTNTGRNEITACLKTLAIRTVTALTRLANAVLSCATFVTIIGKVAIRTARAVRTQISPVRTTTPAINTTNSTGRTIRVVSAGGDVITPTCIKPAIGTAAQKAAGETEICTR